MQVYSPLINWLTAFPETALDFIQTRWECVLVMFAALALIPKGLSLMGLKASKYYGLIVGGLCIAYLLDIPGYGAELTDLFALPYLLLAAWFTFREATELWISPKIRLSDLVKVFALGYWATGAFWAVCFIGGFRPLDFDPVIVSLTAAHFHVAGFVLAVAVYCLLNNENSAFNRFLGGGVLLGMPLVATGITLSKLGFPGWIESLSGVAFVLIALTVVFQHLRLSRDSSFPVYARRQWLFASLCLLGGGLLAAAYAMRFQFPIGFINIPNMKIWHGTLNAVGFGWFVLNGWKKDTRFTELMVKTF